MRLGHPIFPVTRTSNTTEMAEIVPTPAMVVIAVGEKDLQATLKTVPEQWKSHLLLIQNELLPRDWEDYGFDQISVASIWFEKKKGQDSKVVIPTIAYGPAAPLLHSALATLNIPVTIVDSTDELLNELVIKNLYILTTNIAGLRAGGTVSELWTNHRDLAEAVFDDVLTLQQTLTHREFNHAALLQAMLNAFDGDPEHKCMGRSATARLARALGIANGLGIQLNTLESIAKDQ